MMRRHTLAAVGLASLLLFASRPAAAQTPPPERDDTWKAVTIFTVATGAATQLFMPRVFRSDPEVTLGWKARWHVSVLAPVMTLTTLSLVNEYSLSPAIEGDRPDCDDTNRAGPGCATFGMPSTYAFASFAALGHGTAVFLFDTFKWSDGEVNGASLAGNVAAPLVLAVITGIGRGAGNWESGGQIFAGGAAGLGIGFLSGMTYALMQRPECGYTGSLICW